jgi:hypothetical protein
MRSSILLVLGSIALTACGESSSPTGPRSNSLTPQTAARFELKKREAGSRGAVFTQTNATTGNAVVAFARASDGSLTPAGTFSTGGKGIGGTTDPLASVLAAPRR